MTNSTSCDYDAQGVGDDIVGWVLLIGITISFAAQWVELCRHKTSHTISVYNLFLANLNNCGVGLNQFLLTFYQRFECCKSSWSGDVCIEQTMGFLQSIVTICSHTPVFILFLVYMTDKTPPLVQRRAKVLFGVYCCVTAVYVVICTYFAYHGVEDDFPHYFAHAVGFMTAGLTLFVWMPQIVHTYRAKARGALAIPMLAMQAPGTALQAYFLGGPQHTGLTTWLPPACASVQMFALLVLCIYFSRHERRQARLAQERVALLGEGGGNGGVGTDSASGSAVGSPALGGSSSDLESQPHRATGTGSVNNSGYAAIGRNGVQKH